MKDTITAQAYKPKQEIAALATLIIISTVPAFAASTKALELVQTHRTGGQQRLYVTKDAVRLEHQTTGIVAISKSPFTVTYLVNPAKKTCVRKITSKLVNALLQTQILMISNDPVSEEIWSKPETSKLAGLDTFTYRRENRKKSWVKEWVLKEPALPDGAIDMICAFSSAIPSLHGVPLREQRYFSVADAPPETYEKGERVSFIMFDTKSNKVVTVDDKLFEPPKAWGPPTAKTRAMPDTKQVELTRDMFKSPDFMFQSDMRKLNGSQKKTK